MKYFFFFVFLTHLVNTFLQVSFRLNNSNVTTTITEFIKGRSIFKTQQNSYDSFFFLRNYNYGQNFDIILNFPNCF